MSINKELNQTLESISAIAHTAKSHSDVEKAITLIQKQRDGRGFIHNNTLYWAVFALSCLTVLLSIWQQMDFSIETRQNLKLIFIPIGLSSLAIIWFRYRKVVNTGKRLYVRAVSIKAGVERLYNFDARAEWRRLAQTYGMFNAGDEGQKISAMYQGEVGQGDDNKVAYKLFEFRYVDVSTHISTDSNGRTRTHKTKTTRFKYGILAEFKNFNSISINRRSFSTKWDSASRTFNKKFKVRCSNEMAAAKFFDPKTVLAFVDDFHFLKSLEPSIDSVVCLELPKDIFPTNIHSPSLRQTSQFINELQSPRSIPRLEKSKELLQLIQQGT